MVTLNILRHHAGLEVLDLGQATSAFSSAYPDEQQLAAFAIVRLSWVASGMASAAGYATSVVDQAAALAGTNGDFVRLVGAIFAEPSGTSAEFDALRSLLGAGSHPLGSLIEQTHAALYQPGGEDVGFNGWVTEESPWVSTITHHFGEFLRVGYHAEVSVDVAVAAAWSIDTLANRADLASSMVAISVGRALATLQTNPTEAARLIRAVLTDPAAGAIVAAATDQQLQNYQAFQDVMAPLWALVR